MKSSITIIARGRAIQPTLLHSTFLIRDHREKEPKKNIVLFEHLPLYLIFSLLSEFTRLAVLSLAAEASSREEEDLETSVRYGYFPWIILGGSPLQYSF